MNLTDRLEMRILGNTQRDQSVFIYNKYSTIEGLAKVEGINLFIDVSLKQEFIRWAKTQTIDDIAQQLKFSRATAGRLRKALGLSQKYSRSSKATQWRKTREERSPVRCRGKNHRGEQCQRFTLNPDGFCDYHL